MAVSEKAVGTGDNFGEAYLSFIYMSYKSNRHGSYFGLACINDDDDDVVVVVLVISRSLLVLPS